ncbi:signal peptidase I [Hahella ganghwensis]|uniref:signal peptidase I n=1 Tax=Hahella ganghwensis TaxID=286420 RepID=UPI0003747CD4|nr:signal peptidase I [Hahella ganghwensis]
MIEDNPYSVGKTAVLDEGGSIPNWKPKTWIALVLSLMQPLGMLYVGRWKWALFYFLITFVLEVVCRIYHIQFPYGLSVGVLVIPFYAAHVGYFVQNYHPDSKRAWYSHWWGLLLTFVALGLLILAFRAQMYEPLKMPSASMEPSIIRGQHVIIYKWPYKSIEVLGMKLKSASARPKRGELFVFKTPEDESVQYLKRIIGVPGDTVSVEGEQITVNGEVLQKEAISNINGLSIYSESVDDLTYKVQHNGRGYNANGEWTVPAGNYFVLGDNRDRSKDSRFIGFIPEGNMQGKVIHIW